MIVKDFESKIVFWQLRGIFQYARQYKANPDFESFILKVPNFRIQVYYTTDDEYNITSADCTYFVDGVFNAWRSISATEAVEIMDKI